MSLELNDKVEVLDDALRGKVVDISNKMITIETDEGFELTYLENELVKIDKEQSRFVDPVSISEVLRQKQAHPKPKPSPKRTKEKNAPPMEVDLHIEKLVRSHGNMTNYDILNLQMETAQRQIEFAIRKRIQRIVFIHGVGQGVLKAELDFLLGRQDNLKFYDADYQKYGVGATEVYFFQNTD